MYLRINVKAWKIKIKVEFGFKWMLCMLCYVLERVSINFWKLRWVNDYQIELWVKLYWDNWDKEKMFKFYLNWLIILGCCIYISWIKAL
jgi:hypothetical protein